MESSVALLNTAELERVTAMVDPDTRAAHAIGRALLRQVASRETGCGECDLRVAIGSGGKPWLPDAPHLHVSVSHCRRTVVVATTVAAPVGVDVEHPLPAVPDPRRLAQRLFAGAEIRALRNIPDDRIAEWFSSMWTIKEAVGKALGVGIIPALSQVVVESGPAGPRLRAVTQGPAAASWTLHQLSAPDGDERLAVAVMAPDVGLGSVSVLTLDRFARAAAAQGAATART